MIDKHNACNIIHYASNRCKRVCRSVMAAEVHALILGFDYAYLIQNMLHEILGWTMEIEGITDSKTVFNVVAKEAQTTERRLQIDICTVKESYDKGELRRMFWEPGVSNAADPLTKPVL